MSCEEKGPNGKGKCVFDSREVGPPLTTLAPFPSHPVQERNPSKLADEV